MAIEESNTRGERAPMLATAGRAVGGEHRCADCGYGISTFGQLPACPMCHVHEWAPVDGHAFRARTQGGLTVADYIESVRNQLERILTTDHLDNLVRGG